MKNGTKIIKSVKASQIPGIALIIFSCLLANAFLPLSAGAQVFYEFPQAPVVSDEHPAVGPAIAIGDDLFRINGYGRFNVTTNMDMGLEVVFDDVNGDWLAGAGGDVKYGIVPVEYEMPFDLSLNAGLGFESGNNFTTIMVPLGAIISRPLKLSSGNIMTPYGSVYILPIYESKSSGPHGDSSDWSTEVELRGGVSLRLASSTDIFTALHIGNGTKFYIGMNFRL